MKRWIIASCVVAAAGCQMNEQQSSVAQASSECNPGGNFPDATLPKMNLWNHQWPQAGAGQLFLDQKDPYVAGRHYAFLVDPSQSQILWSAIVKDSDLPQFRGGVNVMVGDCCRPPPPPPIGGDDWIARNVLEAGLIYIQVPAIAAANAN